MANISKVKVNNAMYDLGQPFTYYGVQIALSGTDGNMYSYDNNTGAMKVQNVKVIFDKLIDYINAHAPYKKFFNGFISKFTSGTGMTLSEIVFRHAGMGETIALDAHRPMYFDFYCDNITNLKLGKSDAYMNLYGNIKWERFAGAESKFYYRKAHVQLWYLSSTKEEGYSVCRNDLWLQGQLQTETTQATTTTSDVDLQNDLTLQWENTTDTTITINSVVSKEARLNLQGLKFTSMRKAKIIYNVNANLVLHIYAGNEYVVNFQPNEIKEINITANYNEKGFINAVIY